MLGPADYQLISCDATATAATAAAATVTAAAGTAVVAILGIEP